MDTRIATDKLAELLDKKLAMLQQLRELSRRQDNLIADENMTRLLSVLAAKQSLLAELQGIQKQLQPFQNQDPAARTWRCRADQQRCRQVSERCASLLSEIMLIERRSELELKQHRDAAASRLTTNQSASAATRAYLGAPPRSPQHLDICSEE